MRDLVRQLDREQVRTMIDALLAVRDARPQPAASAPPPNGPNGPAANEHARAADEPPATRRSQQNGSADVVRVDFGSLGPEQPPAA